MYPAIPWSDAARTRDRLVHHYFDVDLNIRWQTVTVDLRAVLGALESLPSPDSLLPAISETVAGRWATVMPARQWRVGCSATVRVWTLDEEAPMPDDLANRFASARRRPHGPGRPHSARCHGPRMAHLWASTFLTAVAGRAPGGSGTV